MVHVTSFLTRWLYICNLVRDVADIQTLPYAPLHHHQATIPHPPPPPETESYASHSQQEAAVPASMADGRSGTEALPRLPSEREWKEQCLRGILSYPPGTQRLYALDALRLELVQKLAQQLILSDRVLIQYAAMCRRPPQKHKHDHLLSKDHPSDDGNDESEEDSEEDDPFLDADVEIIRAFEQATAGSDKDEEDDPVEPSSVQQLHEDAVLVISKNGTDVVSSSHDGQDDDVPSETSELSEQQVEEAHRTAVDFRDYLPQLVSAVLKSPPAFQPHLLDPIQKLRRLILTRCLQDPNWGIELCWLLEADVGRAWKTLFEHRQQTGKRLIVVLPAEKAAVIAKIGTEKREAFDLLQDAEQATAYGFTIPEAHHHHHNHHLRSEHGFDPDMEPTPPRLPSSLSLRRCSHFGDTMHFIDRLTQISIDLRRVPDIQRNAWLEECLCEMNRRIRRRMVTKGDVSLDVEDNRGPHDWPQLSDLSADMLKYSVHLPLTPKRVTWPTGEGSDPEGEIAEKTKAGVVRVLNIVTSECRILASRERCPFLVHLEVADTGLEGNDARLYASGASGLGATLKESLAMHNGLDSVSKQQHPSYQIPSELLESPTHDRRAFGISGGHTQSKWSATEIVAGIARSRGANPQDGNENNLVRGGFQSDEGMYYPPETPDYLYTNPYDMMRQHEYEQLHRELQPQPAYQPPMQYNRVPVSTGEALLEKVFGLPWDAKCAQIRQTSPFGKVKGWRLASFIMKAGEDIRREALVMQIISKMKEWFDADIPQSHRPHLRPYTIMCVGGDAGLIECLSDAKSIDELKKRTDGFVSLRDYFERAYGPPKSQPHVTDFRHGTAQSPEYAHITFEQAQDNFLRSLVGYSLVCYVLQIKDRHNANILIDRDGHIMHIDFGFVLGDTPKMGKVPIFNERAPFKLSAEFWEVLGGWNFHEGGLGVRFCKMFERAFASAAAHVEEIASLTEAAMLNLSRNPDTARSLANGVRSRLRMRGPPDSVEQQAFIMDLVNTALTSWRTSTYDWLQKNMNGYQ